MSPPNSRTGKDSDRTLLDRIPALAATPGPPVRIRQAAASDRPAAAQMVSRCSEQTLARRFHSYLPRIPEPYLTEALTGSKGHFALIAQAGETDVVALASCVAADQNGLPRFKAPVTAGQAWVLPILSGYSTCEAWMRDGVFEVTVHRKGQ